MQTSKQAAAPERAPSSGVVGTAQPEVHIASELPFRSITLPWRAQSGAVVLTVVSKATFRLHPGRAAIVEGDEAEPIHLVDDHWDDDATKSVRAPSDMAPFKVKACVVLVGSAYAPRREPASSLVARLAAGDVDKSVEVFADRYIDLDGELHDEARFTRMQLRWERAAGGAGTSNPVGIPVDRRDALGRLPLPNVTPVRRSGARHERAVEPIGFGPIAPFWPARRDALAGGAGSFPPDGMSYLDAPLPERFDASYFNTAPLDQRASELRSDERISLSNLNPDHPELTTRLPGINPIVVVESGGATEVVYMRPDLLWIDTAQAICTLTYRGSLWLKRPSERLRVVVTAERPSAWSEGASPPSDREPSSEAVAMNTIALDEAGAAPSRGALPFSGVGPAGERVDVAPPTYAAALPFAPPLVTAAGTPLSPHQGAAERRAPWGGGSEGSGDRGVINVPEAATPNAAEGGVLAASNAAAERSAVAPPREVKAPPRGASVSGRAAVAREVVRLLPFEATAAEAVRRHQSFRVTLAELELQRIEAGRGVDEEDEGADDKAARERDELFAVLTRAPLADLSGAERLIEAASDADGRYEAPMVVFSGEIDVQFDEKTLAQATSAMMRVVASGDKKLLEALDSADELLKTPWIDGSPGSAEGLIERIRGAFRAGKRGAPLAQVEASVERSLLERRAFQARTLFGKRWIRAVFRGAGDAWAPLYLPEILKDELPLFRRFRARLIGEIEPREDQYEASPWAIKALALGRVIPRA